MSKPEGDSAGGGRGQALVAVVDDDSGVREALCWWLEAHGFAAKGYATGDEFLARCDAERPACVVLDLQMPSLGGWQLMQQLRARAGSLPVVMISGSPRSADPNPELESAVFAFLEKPFDDAVLLDCIRAAIRSGSPKPAEAGSERKP